MRPADAIPLPQGVAKVVTLAELKHCDAWKRAFQSKCHDHRYYEIVEETLLKNDFEHHYLKLEHGRWLRTRDSFV